MLSPCHHALADHLQFMQEQEETTYQIPANYLSRSYATVTHADRRTMGEWSYQIARSCAISREIACIGIQYFDRFLCTSSQRAKDALASRREFQLAFITCLVIALKCRAGMQVDATFVSSTICQKLYDEDEILGMEIDVLSALQWRLSGPSPHEFIAGLTALLPSNAPCTAEGSLKSNPLAERLTDLAHAQAEQAMLDYSTALEQSPSSIAYAALITAMQSMGTDVFFPLDRLAWINNIEIATNRKRENSGATTRQSSVSKKVVHQRNVTLSSISGSPVASSIQPEENMNAHHPYLDILSIANSRQCATNYLSPISAMLDNFEYENW